LAGGLGSQSVFKDSPVEVNLADPEAIREKLPEVHRWVEGKRGAVQRSQRELETAEALLEQLKALAGTTPTSSSVDRGKVESSRKDASAQDAVIRVINDAKRPLRAVDVASEIDVPVKRETVNWALWHAEKEGLIQRVSQGLYAALDYDSPQDDLPPPQRRLPTREDDRLSARETRRQSQRRP
jgi:hypothetical protein